MEREWPGTGGESGRIHRHSSGEAQLRPKFLDTIRRKLGNVSLHIQYEDAEGEITKRLVTPLALMMVNRKYSVYAWCHLREDFRTFELAQMRSVDPVGLKMKFTARQGAEAVASAPKYVAHGINEALCIFKVMG